MYLEDKEKVITQSIIICQQEEIDKLTNNWNELEEWCQSWKDNDKYCYLASSDIDKCRYDIWEEVLDKMKEIEENNDEY